MKVTRDITLGNVLTIIAMVGALLAFALRIEARMTRMETQIERLILNGQTQHGGTSRNLGQSVDQLPLPLPLPLPLVSTVDTRKAALFTSPDHLYSARARIR